MANAAFYFGLVRRSPRASGRVVADVVQCRRGELPRAAAAGIDAQVYWPGVGKVRATELVLRRLLPMARTGLEAWASTPPRASGCSTSSGALNEPETPHAGVQQLAAQVSAPLASCSTRPRRASSSRWNTTRNPAGGDRQELQCQASDPSNYIGGVRAGHRRDLPAHRQHPRARAGAGRAHRHRGGAGDLGGAGTRRPARQPP